MSTENIDRTEWHKAHDQARKMAEGLMGGFAEHLAEAFFRADYNNGCKLINTFPELFRRESV
jgi:hypothetical protein